MMHMFRAIKARSCRLIFIFSRTLNRNDILSTPNEEDEDRYNIPSTIHYEEESQISTGKLPSSTNSRILY